MDFTSDTMLLVDDKSAPFLRYKALSKIPFINHLFSTRLGGVSEGDCFSMNLGFNRGDKRENVIENYRILCESGGFDFNSLVASSQTHDTFVRKVTASDKGIGIYRKKDIASVDALITNEKGVTLCTYYADCTPLFFVDTKQRAIALAHAGWRGTVKGIGYKVTERMKQEYASSPADITVCIGPAIAKCCYEVDEKCAAEFYSLGLRSESFIFPKGGGKFMLDLPEANRQILIKAGVKSENIILSDLCTCCRSDLLWSHRATKGKRGVMCAMMCLR